MTSDFKHLNMARLTDDIKKIIIELYESGTKVKDISKTLRGNIPQSTIYDFLRKYKTTGEISNKRRRKRVKVTDEILNYLKKYVEENRYVYFLTIYLSYRMVDVF